MKLNRKGFIYEMKKRDKFRNRRRKERWRLGRKRRVEEGEKLRKKRKK